MVSEEIMNTVLANSKMELRACGTHGLKLPILGMGCWGFGDGDYWGPSSQKEINEVVRCAVAQGCNFFDTAEAYNGGASEESLGRALRGLPRHRVIIATKISPSNTGPATLVKHCEASLRRLQTDYIDVYIVHWPITESAVRHLAAEGLPLPTVPDAFTTLARLQQQGKIRSIGVSNFGRARLDEALATGADIVLNELPYSLLARAIELDILPYCRSKGIGVVGYMALMQGVLADTYPALDQVPTVRRRTRHFDGRRIPQCRHGLPGAERETNAALKALRGIARAHGMTLAELALKWTFAGKGITSSLCGSRTLSQLEMNIAAAAQPLSPALIEELNRATQSLMDKLGPSFDYYENPANDRTR
jgi:aryl-alcohol dehydrogenase-like predicted oxidoreductase